MKAYRAPVTTPPKVTTITDVPDETIEALVRFVNLGEKLMDDLPIPPPYVQVVREFINTLQRSEELNEPFELVTENGEITLR